LVTISSKVLSESVKYPMLANRSISARDGLSVLCRLALAAIQPTTERDHLQSANQVTIWLAIFAKDERRAVLSRRQQSD
jgi:hypothetical protein